MTTARKAGLPSTFGGGRSVRALLVLAIAMAAMALLLPSVGQAAVVWQGTSTGSVSGGTSLVVAMPSGVVSGDALIAQVTVSGTAAAVTAPAGWTSVRSSTNGTALRQITYRRQAGASEPSTYSWTFSTATAASGTVLAYRGALGASFVNVSSGATGTGTSLIASSVTTTVANALLVDLYGVAASTSFVPPAGMTFRSEVSSSGTTSGAAEVLQPTAGASAAPTSTAGVSGAWIAHLIAITPDATGPSVSLTAPSANLRGTISLSGTATDAGSGLASIAIEYSPAGAGTWTTIALPTSSPYSASFDTTSVPDGLYDFRVVGTDNGGNLTASVVTNRRIDNTVPSVVLTDPGTPLHGTVTLSATATDTGGSGVASVSFEYSLAGANTWTVLGTDASSPYSLSFNTTLLADGLYDLRAIATDAAGNQTVSALVASRAIDNTLPSASIVDPGSPLRGIVALSGSGSDTGSGLASLAFQRRPTSSSGAWTTIATLTGTPFTISFNTASVGDNLYDLRVLVTDVAGNTQTAVVTSRRIDNTAPTVSLADPGANTHGTISLSGTATDAGSGLASIAIEYSPAGAGTWTTIALPTSSPYSASFDTTSVPDGLYDFRVVVTDAAGNSSTASRTSRRIDNSSPVVSLASVAAALHGTVTLSATATDTGGSGVASVSFEYSPVDAGSWSSIGSDASSPYSRSFDTTLLADGLYDLRAVATDAAGNQTVSALVASRAIDNTLPSASIVDPGSPLRGSVSLTGAAADSGSGVASLAFQRRPTSSSGAWTTIATLTGTPFTISFNTASVGDNLYDLRVLVTDVAGNTQTAVVTSRRIDNTAPAASLASLAAAIHGTVTLTGTATDAGSGIVSVLLESSPAGAGTWTTITTLSGGSFSFDLDTTALADGLYDFRVVVTDAAGNSSTASRTSRRIDNSSPVVSLASVAAALHGTVTLSATATDTGGSGVASVSFEYSPVDAGSWSSIGSDASSPYSRSFDTTLLADGLYDLRAVATDAAGNQTVSALVASRAIDNTLPSASIVDPGSPLRGSVSLTGAAADSGSGVASLAFQRRPTSSSGAWTTIATLTSAPYDVTFDTAGVSDNLYDLRVLVTDVAGNTQTAVVTSRRIDNTAPTASLDDPGMSLRGTATLGGTTSDAGSGIASAQLEYSPAGDATWTAIASLPTGDFSFDLDTTTLADGLYDFRIVATDAAGNSATASRTGRRIDNTGPTAALADPGEIVHGAVLLTASVADGGSGVATVTLEYSPAAADSWTALATLTAEPFSFELDTTLLADGLYDLRAVATDAAGNQTVSALVASRAIDNALPSASLTDPGSPLRGSVPLTGTAADSGSGVASVAFQRRLSTSSGAWTTIAMLTSAPYDVTFDTAGVSDNLYDLRVLVTDVAGNTQTAVVTSRRIDNAAPTVGLATPKTSTPTSVGLSAVASDTGSGIASVTFEYSPVGAGDWTEIGTDSGAPYAMTFDTTLLADGLYHVRATTTDNAGNKAASVSRMLPVRLPSSAQEQGDAPPAEHGSQTPAAETPETDEALSLKLVGPPTIALSGRRFLAVRVTVSMEAAMTATLIGPGQQIVGSSQVELEAGATVLRIRIPRSAKRAGLYAVEARAAAGGAQEAVARIVIRARSKRANMPAAGPGHAPTVGIVFVSSPKPVVTTHTRPALRTFNADPQTVFDVVADRSHHVRVVVIDADRLGAGLVRDLALVFPDVRIVAISSSRRSRLALLRAGAAAAIPPATAAELEALVRAIALRSR